MNAKLVCQAVSVAKGLAPAMQLALIHMAAMSDRGGIYRDGQAALIMASGIRSRTLTGAISALEEAGLIKRDYHHRKDGRRAADRIALTLDNAQKMPVVNRRQPAKSALGQGAGNALGQCANFAGPIRVYITTDETVSEKTTQEEVCESASNNLPALRLVVGGVA
jgi:DNA-binding MarR family transcriptional regulator